jgi:3-dehydroquinate dehydratase-2
MRVTVINGPNLDLLGTREPEVYGSTTLGDLEQRIALFATGLGVDTTFVQSNEEGDLIEAIHGARGEDGIVINPGALTHTSRALGDAISAVGVPAVEVHISNVREREPWRAVSLVSEACARTIYGRGLAGYEDAVRHLVNRAAVPVRAVRYGPHRDQAGDLRVPNGGPRGIVLLVHGGFWLDQYQRDGMESLAVDLTGRGWTTWNLEYRRLGSGGGWPASGHDVVTAIDSVSQVADGTPGPMGIIGHSAGGHLALWAALRPREPVALTVGLAPVTDLQALSSSGGAGSGPASRLLADGAPPAIDGVPEPTLLIHGDADDVVPPEHSTRVAGAQLNMIPGFGHFELLDPKREHWAIVIDALEAADG